MDMKSVLKRVIIALELEIPRERRSPLVQELVKFLRNLEAGENNLINPSLVSKLNTLLREVTANGSHSHRAVMLINEIMASNTKKFPWPDLSGRDIKGATLGQLISVAVAGFNTGKSMLRKVSDVPTLSMSQVSKIVYDKKAQTLFYLDEHGVPLFVVSDYKPSEVKVEIRERGEL